MIANGVSRGMMHHAFAARAFTALLSACAFFAVPAVTPALADKALVELFTSQGCSSCPPADAYLAELATRDDVVALSFHVDYWDRLGWTDTLGSPENSARQHRYAAARGDGRVYTPQIVVAGAEHAVGSVRRDVERLIAAAPSKIEVTCTRRDGTLEVSLGDAGAVKASLWLAVFEKRTAVPVAHGENGGRKIAYAHSVTALRPAARWDGTAGVMTLDMPTLAAGEGAAIFVQTEDGRILGADYAVR